jgi:tRNA threonylcarbamoyladenosine biosynthesis protein TsaE
MSSLNREIHDLAELQQWVDAFLMEVKTPSIISVFGEMGAGKTTTIAMICRSLGYSFAGSPTFALVQEYHADHKPTIFHFDLYRVQDIHELIDMGFEEYLDQNALIFIEWPQIAEPFLKENTRNLRITETSGIRQMMLTMD